MFYTEDEINYGEGRSIGSQYLSMSQPTYEQAMSYATPRNWSEAKENGFWDAVTEYFKGNQNA